MSFNLDLRKKYRGRIRSLRGKAIAGTNTEISRKLNRNYWLAAVQILLTNQKDRDRAFFSVVDKEFIYVGDLYPATPTQAGIPNVAGMSWQDIMPDGVQLDMFGDDVPFITDRQDQGKEDLGYWAFLKKDLYIVMNYVSTGATDVTVRAKLYLHEIKTRVDK